MELRIALPDALTETVAVYVDDGAGELAERSLVEVAAAWIAAKLDEPLRRALLDCLDSPSCSIEVVARNRYPEPPPGVLMLAGEEERRRQANATAICVVQACYRFGHPLLGLLFARAVSQAIVEATGGVALEPAVPRLRRLESRRAPPHDASVVIAHFVDVVEVRARSGALALRTAGMARFGLPDFLIAAVSERSAPSMRWFLLGVAQRFLMEALSCQYAGLCSIHCLDELVIDAEDVAQAFGRHSPSLPPEIAARFSALREGLMLVGPPRSFRGTAESWADSIPDALFGLQRSA